MTKYQPELKVFSMKTLEETLNYLSKKYSKESGVMNESDYSVASVPQLLWMLVAFGGGMGKDSDSESICRILSSYSSFVCMDKTFRYNYGFFQTRIVEFFDYLKVMRERLEVIVSHYNKLFSQIVNASSFMFVYDEVYVYCVNNKGKVELSLDEAHFVRYKKKVKDSFTLQLKKDKDGAVLAAFEFKENNVSDDDVKELANTINQLLG